MFALPQQQDACLLCSYLGGARGIVAMGSIYRTVDNNVSGSTSGIDVYRDYEVVGGATEDPFIVSIRVVCRDRQGRKHVGYTSENVEHTHHNEQLGQHFHSLGLDRNRQ